jgi:hypothetical protein
MLLTPVKKVIGIEQDDTLHTIAMEKMQHCQTDLPLFFNDRLVHLVNHDFLTTDFNEATVIFISAVCFKQSTLIALANKLNQLPLLRAVYSLKPLTHFTKLSYQGARRIQCSWGAALCYCYLDKNSATAPKNRVASPPVAAR